MNRSRWLVASLVVSLVINIALVGFVFGRISGGGFQAPMFDPLMSVTRALRVLPEERRSELRPLIGKQMRAMGPSVRRLRRAQHELYQAILADPYSRSAVEQSLTAFRENLNTSQATSHEGFADVIDALSPTERQQLLQHMRSRALRHRGEGRRPPRDSIR